MPKIKKYTPTPEGQCHIASVFFVNISCFLCFCGRKKLATKPLILKGPQKIYPMFQFYNFLTI